MDRRSFFVGGVGIGSVHPQIRSIELGFPTPSIGRFERNDPSDGKERKVEAIGDRHTHPHACEDV